MTATLTTLAYIVKERYMDGKFINTAARSHPLYMKLSKKPKFTGSLINCPVQHANPQGVASSFAGAKAAKGSSSGITFKLTRTKKYAYGELDSELMAATKDDEGAFVRATSTEIENTLKSWVDSFAFELYGTGEGILATVIGTPAANVITLTNPEDAKKFEVGMYLEVRDTTDATRRVGLQNLTPGGASFYKVTAVDESLGKVTVDDDQNIVSTDIIYRYETRDATIPGLAAWLPSSAPTATLFYNVDRTVHPTRLAGHRVDGSTGELKEAIRELAAQIHNRQGRPRWGFMNATNFVTLEQELQTKATIEEGGPGQWGFSKLDMVTPAGTISMYPDPDCPPDKVYLLDPNHVELRHLQPLPHIIDEDGNALARLDDADGVEFRARGWVSLAMNYPGAHGVVHSIA